MAEEGNEDSWLYGSGEEQPGVDASTAEEAAMPAAESPEDEGADAKSNGATKEATEEVAGVPVPDAGEPEEVVPNPGDEMEEADHEEGERVSGEENSESEEDDDDINVVIGDIKSGPNYNIKQRGAAGAAAAAGTATATDKSGKPAPGGKFNMEEFESVGTINGVAAHEYSIDSLEEKPWRKPGADITDYFNYGFNEETWRMYCERQKRMRQNESGVGLQGLMVAPVMAAHSQVDRSAGPGGRTLTPIANDNSKYGALTSMPGNRRAGPPPTRRMAGPIDVIGGGGGGMAGNGVGKQENVIQVMTAERREYSRPGMPSGGKFDMPPPVFSGGPPPQGGPPGPRGMGGGDLMVDAFADEFNSYGYEPTQDSQWGAGGGGNPGWAPSGVKELVSVMPQMVPAPMGPGMGMPPQMMQGMPPQQMPPHQRPPMERPGDRDRSMRGERSDREMRERERDRGEKERGSSAADRDRRSRMEREGSRRRDRSRSRDRSSRRRSRSKEKTRDRGEKERSSRSDRKEKDKDKDKEKEKKREGKDEAAATADV